MLVYFYGQNALFLLCDRFNDFIHYDFVRKHRGVFHSFIYSFITVIWREESRNEWKEDEQDKEVLGGNVTRQEMRAGRRKLWLRRSRKKRKKGAKW